MSKEIRSSVIEKYEKKLARWKRQYLSLGGRVTLINTVLDVIVGTCNHCKLYIEYRSVVQWKRVCQLKSLLGRVRLICMKDIHTFLSIPVGVTNRLDRIRRKPCQGQERLQYGKVE